jgi:hypothetical protein
VGEDQTKAFQELKNRITHTPVLALVDDSKPFRMEANSSDIVTNAVLLQQSDVDSKWHPIAYLSKSLSMVERNYEIHDKEMLAIMRGLVRATSRCEATMQGERTERERAAAVCE